MTKKYNDVLVLFATLILVVTALLFSTSISPEPARDTYSSEITLLNNTPIPPGIVGYVYLVKYDVLDFTYSFQNVDKWCVNILVSRIATGETYNYSSCGTESKPVTPIFRAPSTGFYKLSLNVTDYVLDGPTGRVYLTLTIKSVGLEFKRSYTASIVYPLVLLAILLATLGVVGVKASIGNVFLIQVYRELIDAYKIYTPLFMIVTITLLYVRAYSEDLYILPTFLEYSRRIPHTSILLYLYDRVVFTHTDPMVKYIIYALYVVVIATLLFAYEDENGVTRTKMLAGLSRKTIFASKILSLVILIVAPLTILYASLFYIVDFELALTRPLLYLDILTHRVLLDLIVLLFLVSVSVLVSVATRRVYYSMLTSLAVCIVAPYFNIIISRDQVLGFLVPKISLGFNTQVFLQLMLLMFFSIALSYKLVLVRDYG